MAVNEAKIIYYQNDGSITEIELEDVMSCSVRRTSKVKNNSADLTLKNPIRNMSGTRPLHKWVNDDGTLVFKTPRRIGIAALENPEKIEIFAKQLKDADDSVDTSSTSTDRLFTGFITEVEGKGTVKSTTLRLKLTDRNTILLNNNGVGIYSKPDDKGTITGVTATTITDSAQSWTTDEHKGKIVLIVNTLIEYRYTIISNDNDTLTVKPDDDVDGDGHAISDDFEVCWTTPCILQRQVNSIKEAYGGPTDDQLIANFDFEGSDRRLITAIGAHTLTLSGAAYTINELKERYGHITSGTNKGKGLTIKSNTATTLTFYGDTDLTGLSITASTDYFTIAGDDSGIETMRSDGSAYPAITFSKAFKPFYEWCEELSQIANLNTATEINDASVDIVCEIPAVYHVNTRNIFFWFYPSDESAMEVDVSSKIAVGSDDVIHEVKGRSIKNKVKDNINFIIYRYKNFNGIELLDYFFNPLNGAPTVQDCYRPYYTVSNAIIKQAFVAGEIDSEEYGATITVGGYPMTAYPVWWSESSTEALPVDDAAYIALFELECIHRCNFRAESEVNRSGNGRWGGTVQLDFEPIQVNEVMSFTDWALGVPTTKMRITEVTYQMRKQSFRSDVKIEEDLDPYSESVS